MPWTSGGGSPISSQPSGTGFARTETPGTTSPVSFGPLTQPSLPATSSSSLATQRQSVEKPITHKLRDGDSLSALADHYLGSAERRLEIFEANRDALKNPDVLPIGVEIKIPPKVSAPVTNVWVTPDATTLSPLTPVGKMTVGGR